MVSTVACRRCSCSVDWRALDTFGRFLLAGIFCAVVFGCNNTDPVAKPFARTWSAPLRLTRLVAMAPRWRLRGLSWYWMLRALATVAVGLRGKLLLIDCNTSLRTSHTL